MATNSNTNEKAERCTAHHRWQRSILGISWKDRVTNEEVRVRTGQYSMDDMLKTNRNGVKVWSNASTWTRVEPRSRSSVY